MVDPIWSIAFSVMLSGLFAFSAWHKLTNRLEFSSVMATYKIIPVQWCYIAGLLVASLEGLAALLTIFQLSLGLWLMIALLLAYAVAIGINLVKGRVHIDCGCGGAPIHLTPWLLVRNGVLALMVFVALAPVNTRELGFLDLSIAGLAAIALLMLYVCANQLLANRSYWRMQNGVNE